MNNMNTLLAILAFKIDWDNVILGVIALIIISDVYFWLTPNSEETDGPIGILTLILAYIWLGFKALWYGIGNLYDRIKYGK